MKANYEYILAKSSELNKANGKILDYGCGKGNIVKEGLERGMDIYGVEAFAYGSGTNIKDYIANNEQLSKRIREIDIQDNKIPFPDNYFDLIISNQVFEHLPDINAPLSELKRVLNSDGKLLLIFPAKNSIREGHCGVLFAHWLPKSQLRYYWLLLNRSLGLCRGKNNKRKTNKKWAASFNDWLVDSVTYRSIDTIHKDLSNYFSSIQHIEDDYLAFRLNRVNRKILGKLTSIPILSGISRFVVQRWASLVMVIH